MHLRPVNVTLHRCYIHNRLAVQETQCILCDHRSNVCGLISVQKSAIQSVPYTFPSFHGTIRIAETLSAVCPIILFLTGCCEGNRSI
uniref:Phlebovirus_G2 domain-containing protein n=1 Tax=Steinernema glaseri TaxID=37863 RepID=A0A1I8AAU0_9BILA